MLHCCCRAVYLNIPMFGVTVSIFGLLGLVMFTYYQGCDPVQAGRVASPNQVDMTSLVCVNWYNLNETCYHIMYLYVCLIYLLD